MGKHKAPAPRGFDPGGFRFPGATPFKVPHETTPADHEEERRKVGSIGVPEHMGAAVVLSAAMLAARFAGRGRRHG